MVRTSDIFNASLLIVVDQETNVKRISEFT